ncbi:short-chain dehydrogenase [Pseudoalteromonas gelatinilytica]
MSYPSPEEFLIEVPLYKKIVYSKSDAEQGLMIRYFSDTFDAYCPECGSHSIFEPFGNYKPHISIDNIEKWVDCGFFDISVRCTRDRNHELHFKFFAQGYEIQKIGQYPSIADLSLFDVKKYSKVLEQNYFKEFTKAIGLAAHGVGVGSFVYLRRIFELLIDDAHKKAQQHEAWDDIQYSKARMNDKIELLKDELPAFLVDNRAIYSILSKGIHELSEEICLEAFPAIKLGIELILDEKLEQSAKELKLREATRAIRSIASNI